MKISIALQNSMSISDVVQLVNQGGTSEFDGNQLAGQYAFDAARDQEDTSMENIMAHLENLADAGAKFDSQPALVEAEKFKLYKDAEEDNENA